MDRPCRIELLGALRVQQGERVISRFHTYKTAALLARLAYTRSPQSRDVVIEMLWPDGSGDRGRNNLSVALSSLRNQLEPPGLPSGAVLIADRLTVGLNPATAVTDVAEFETLLASAVTANGEAERARLLMQAVELYHGELLPGYYQEWILPERERLAELYLHTLRRLVRHLARRRDLDGAIDIARRAVAAAPLREEVHQDLVRVLIAAGQPSAALRQYREFEQALLEAHGERPSAESVLLLEKIEGDLRTVRERPAPASSPPVTVHRPAPAETMSPSGIVTFLLLDERGPDRKGQPSDAETEWLQSRNALVVPVIQRHRGRLFRQSETILMAAFARASAALECAVACRRTLDGTGRTLPGGVPGTRIAIHACEADLQRDDYQGAGLDHAVRLLTAAHGGQTLCSEATLGLLGPRMDTAAQFVDLGAYRLRGSSEVERLFQVEAPNRAKQEFPAPDADTIYSDTLPLQFTRFFGREQEMARLEDLLLGSPNVQHPHSRLVTLTGPGGTGKTRLALEMARRIQASLSGAVWFVPLADLREARLIPGAIADAMRLSRAQEGDPLEQVVEMLARQTSVLILDNLEHLVETGAPIIHTLLARAPTLRCLVTSRQALNLGGERVFPLEPLPTPGGSDTPERLCLYESVQLFIDRAQAVRPDFQVTGSNAAAVATLCDNLDGIPLAIELAAARAAVLTPAQMLAQLQNRLDFLVSRYRDANERHRTLRAAMEWSYQLLSPELQQIFARLSVFCGGFTEAEAEAVCEAGAPEGGGPSIGLSLDRLAQLRECSLVIAREQGPTMRFRLLETVRRFGLEHLGAEETDRLRLCHAQTYLQVVRRLDARLRDGDSTAIAEGQAEMDNLREALRWSCAAEAFELAADFARSVGRLWIQLGCWDEFMVRAPVLRRALQTVKDPQGEARLLDLCANILHRQGKHDEALRNAAEALALWQLCGHERMAALLSNLAWYAFHAGDLAESGRQATESLNLGRANDDGEAIGLALAVLADLALERGSAADAYALALEARDHFAAVRDRAGMAVALERLGAAELLADTPDSARRSFLEALDLLRGLGYRFGVANVLVRLGALYRERETEVAAALFALVTHIDRDLGAPGRHITRQKSPEPNLAALSLNPRSTSYEAELDQLLPRLLQPL